MKKLYITAIIFIVVFGALLTTNCTNSPKEAVAQPLENRTKTGSAVGEIAPDFLLTATDGTQLSLADRHGKPVVLVFWSAYCVSCKEEAPKINQLVEEFKSKNVEIIGINIGESEARTAEGIREFPIKYKVVRDEGRKITQSYKVLGTPTVIFLDKKGIVRYNGNELPQNSADFLNKMISET